MPGQKDAEYWRQYRAKKAAAEELKAKKIAEALPQQAENQAVPKSGAKPLPTKSGYQCGCEPGSYCTAHGIARMTQKQRDAVLARINKSN